MLFTSLSKTTLTALVDSILTAPEKSLSVCKRVMFAAFELLSNFVVLSASNLPFCSIFPLAVRLKAPVASDSAIIMSEPSVIVTVEPAKSTLPKFAVVPSPRVMALPPETKVAKPTTVRFPVSVIVPDEVTLRAPPTFTVPKLMAFASVTSTRLVPVLIKLTAPAKSFA